MSQNVFKTFGKFDPAYTYETPSSDVHSFLYCPSYMGVRCISDDSWGARAKSLVPWHLRDARSRRTASDALCCNEYHSHARTNQIHFGPSQQVSEPTYTLKLLSHKIGSSQKKNTQRDTEIYRTIHALTVVTHECGVAFGWLANLMW